MNKFSNPAFNLWWSVLPNTNKKLFSGERASEAKLPNQRRIKSLLLKKIKMADSMEANDPSISSTTLPTPYLDPGALGHMTAHFLYNSKH